MRNLRRLTIAAMSAVVLSGCGMDTPAPAGVESPPPPVIPSAAERGWTPVAQWSGRGSRQTETFTMLRHEWQLRWEAQPAAGGTGAPHLVVTVHSADSGRILAAPLDHVGAGSGVVEIVEEPRQFYLTVESAGVDWVLRVEESGGRTRRP